MPLRLDPVRIPVPGGKVIGELAGKASTQHGNYSVAHMVAPAGWQEPGQRPDFDEVTYVIAGEVRVEHDGGSETVAAGEAILTRSGEWVRYSTGDQGAEYLAVCVPAFTPESAHRDD